MNLLRTESRVIRPFKGLNAANKVLDRVQLKQGQKLFSPGTIILPTIKLKEQHFSLVLDTEHDDFISACTQAGLNPDHVTLFVFANSRTLRKSTLIFEMALNEARKVPKEIEIEDTYGDELSRYVFHDSAGFQVVAALVLNQSLQPKPLKIHKVGTFLAKTSFVLKPEEDLSSFAPEPLTDMLRADFNLPKSCMSYIYLQETILSTEDLSESITVYLDSEILNLLLIDESDQVSKHIQVALAIQTLEALLMGISRALEKDGLEYSDLSENSGSISFLQKLSGDLRLSIEELLSLCQRDPSKLRSQLEDKFKVQTLVEQLLKRGQ